MLKRLRAAHPILLHPCRGTVPRLPVLSSLVLTVALVAAGADFSGLDEYLLSLVQELVGAGEACLLLRRTGRQGLLGRRGSGFWNGLLVGMYPLAFICYSVYSALIFERPDTPLLPAGRILSFLACMAMVGVAEEFLFRGVIAETLLEHFGTSRVGVWKACLLSGVLFGAAHLTNLSSSAPLRRADAVRVLGVAGSAVCGHLLPHRQPSGHSIPAPGPWTLPMLIGGLYGTTTLSESVSGHDPMLLTVVVYLLPVAFLLREKKLPEVQLYWGAYTKNEGSRQKNPCNLPCNLVYCICYRGSRAGSMPAYQENRFRHCSIGIKFYKEV